jgi:hypothetical protein
MKRCVLVLLSSCITQGIGWLFGPFITIFSPTAGNILGWFFIIFNGLEGFWSILVYVIIRSQHMDEQKRVVAARELMKSRRSICSKYLILYGGANEKENSSVTRETNVKYRNTQDKMPRSYGEFDYL